MRIISDFHDYYDGVQRLGFDDSIVYVRNTSKSIIQSDADRLKYATLIEGFNILPYSQMFREYYIPFNILYVCGKSYPFAKIKTRPEGLAPAVVHNCFSFDAVTDVLDNMDKRDEYRNGSGMSWNSFDNTRKGYEGIFEHFKKTDCSNMFHVVGSPVFILEKGDAYSFKNQLFILRNIRLADYGFQKVMDPYTMYQELEMYIPGVLGSRDKPALPMSDDVMRDKKGFDKWSFRTKSEKEKK